MQLVYHPCASFVLQFSFKSCTYQLSGEQFEGLERANHWIHLAKQ